MLIGNSFAAGVNGATVAAGGFGTASGWQFDLVSIGTGQSMTYDTTVPFGALPSVKIVTTTTGAAYGMWQAAQPTAGRSLTGSLKDWFCVWLQRATVASALHQVVVYTSSGTRIGDVVLTAAGNLALRDTNGTTILTSASLIPNNVWFRIEGYMLSSATVGQMELQYFSNPFGLTPDEVLTTTATLNTNGGTINQVRYGASPGVSAGLTWRMARPAVSDGGYIGINPTPLSLIAGAPTSSGFQVVSKMVGATSLRLKVATDAALTQNVQYVAAQTPDSYGYVRHVAGGLSPATRYYCQVADTPLGGSETLAGSVATIKTLPPSGSPQSFRLAIGSCILSSLSGVVSPTAAIDDLVTWNADLNVMTGDFGYFNPSATDVPTQVATYEQMMAYFSVANILANGWGFYNRSDHDSTNVDNGDSNNAWTAANIQAALEVFPWGTLGDTRQPTVGLYQSWVIGRVRFIQIDQRSTDRSPGAATDGPSKTMLGATQLAWLYGQLSQAEPLKVIIGDNAWMGSPTGGDLDKWWSYDYERQQIIAYMAANRNTVGNVLWIHGDDHCVACCPGSSNTWGGFPVYCAAPIRNLGAAVPNVSATFPQFYNNAGGDCRQYGRVTFTDTGSAITVQFSGWDALNGLQRVFQADSFPLLGKALPAVATAATASLGTSGTS